MDAEEVFFGGSAGSACCEDDARAQCDDERVRGNAAVSTTENYTARLNAVHLYVHVHRVLSHIDSAPNFTAEIVSMHDQRGHKLCSKGGGEGVAAHNTVDTRLT